MLKMYVENTVSSNKFYVEELSYSTFNREKVLVATWWYATVQC